MKEQIEEMAKALMNAINEKHCHTSMRGLAEALYNAGYRKQKEGEWRYNEDCECFVCSVCGNSALNNYRGLSVDSNFCPNCGAHMTGGKSDAR